MGTQEQRRDERSGATMRPEGMQIGANHQLSPIQSMGEFQTSMRRRRRHGSPGGVPGFGLTPTKVPSMSQSDSQKSRSSEMQEDADLHTYAAELVRALGMSDRAAKAMQKQMASTSLREQLALISDLESELEATGNSLPCAASKDTEKKNIHGNQETHLHDGDDSNSAEDIDEAWEILLANAELNEEQISNMSRQFYALEDAEQRLHMYFEFSSYLRPFSQAQLDFQARMQEAQKHERGMSSSSSLWPWTSTMQTSFLSSAKDETTQTPWYKSPKAVASAIFATALLRYSL